MKIGVIAAGTVDASLGRQGAAVGQDKTGIRAMIPHRYRQWVFLAFMTLFMSMAISGVMKDTRAQFVHLDCCHRDAILFQAAVDRTMTRATAANSSSRRQHQRSNQ